MTSLKTIKLSDVILPHYNVFFNAYRDNLKTFFILKGGRNSAKSTHISIIAIVLDIIENPVTSVVAKRYSNSLPLTVIPQIKWALNLLGVSHLFKESKARGSESLIYIPRGNKIIFLGADEPDRIKGLKNDKFPVARLWVDEITQFLAEDDLDNIKNSIIRDELPSGIKYKICYSYNPPKRKRHWCNKKYESVTIGKDYYILHSSYMNNKYVSKDFIIEAEYIKSVNPRKYDHEYMGLPIGSGVVPFDNLTFREITDDEIKNFDNIKQGLDWGYSIDPVHFSRMHYDKTRKKLYIFGEIHEVKLGNEKLVEKIKAKGWDDIEVVADSAEPKSIDDLNSMSISCIKASKPSGSVEHGEKWLDEREEIIIDPIRCPNTAREWENIDYAVDKDGNPKDKLCGKDNHSIDSIRYALENEMNRNDNEPKIISFDYSEKEDDDD